MYRRTGLVTSGPAPRPLFTILSKAHVGLWCKCTRLDCKDRTRFEGEVAKISAIMVRINNNNNDKISNMVQHTGTEPNEEL